MDEIRGAPDFSDMLSFGESYMYGDWDVDDLEEYIFGLSQKRVFQKLIRLLNKEDQSVNLQTPERSTKVIYTHYDLGNDLFKWMLDSNMVYTCGYWRSGAKDLDQSQIDKVLRICKKLELEDGMSVLDIGCGFGGFARIAKQYYNIKVVGYTLSENQAQIARQYCDEVFVDDYRNIKGKFDRVISLGLMEHIGYMNYRTYMKVVYRSLKNGGITLYHTIGHNVSHRINDPWIDKYIFPNGMLPSLTQLSEASEIMFIIEDIENFGTDYVPTLRAWYQNCKKHKSKIIDTYGEVFYRMWKFYLLFSAARFRNREFQVWQTVMTKKRLEQPKRV